MLLLDLHLYLVKAELEAAQLANIQIDRLSVKSNLSDLKFIYVAAGANQLALVIQADGLARIKKLSEEGFEETD